jgi:hypothetical protein
MALSKADQAFYEEKLSYKSVGYLFGTTCVLGAVIWPTLIYMQDWSMGQTSGWSTNVAVNLGIMGFLLGSVVSFIMYMTFKFLLSMGWLPSRR